MILVGEAEDGRSHVLRSLMWFAYQHGCADSTFVTLYKGCPVSNLRNFAVRGLNDKLYIQSNKYSY